jgi:hypothetical protein
MAAADLTPAQLRQIAEQRENAARLQAPDCAISEQRTRVDVTTCPVQDLVPGLGGAGAALAPVPARPGITTRFAIRNQTVASVQYNPNYPTTVTITLSGPGADVTIGVAPQTHTIKMTGQTQITVTNNNEITFH